MYQLPPSIQIIYKNNDELLEIKFQAIWEQLCFEISAYNLDPSVLEKLKERFERLKKLANSFWMMPDMKDLLEIVDHIIKTEQKNMLGDVFHIAGKNPRTMKDVRV
jgi:hypothetical protein